MAETQFAMVSGWIANGNVNDFVKARPGVYRFGLVLPLLTKTSRPIYIRGQGMVGVPRVHVFDN